MLTHHQPTTIKQHIVESIMLDDIANIVSETSLDFKLSMKSMMSMYGAVKTDALPFIEKHMREYKIDNKKRMSAFLASCFILSCGFRRGAETFNMSACRLIKEHPDKVSNIAMAKKVVKCGDREVANLIYSFAHGNGGIDSDDGWSYRARTPLQFKGRCLYTIVANRTKLDCLNHPELLDDLENSVIAAMAIWEHFKYNDIVDKIKFSSSFELDSKVSATGAKNYRSNSQVVKLRKKLDGNTSQLMDFCNFIENGMLYL